MDKQAKNEMLKFIEDIDGFAFSLKRLAGDPEGNQFEIRKQAEVINIYTEVFLEEVYGVKIKRENLD